jgi:uncharacterized oligopeptide transporter (OPT) family protein
MWFPGLVLSFLVATGVLGTFFPMPYWQVTIAMSFSMLIAVLAVRALGATDLNPVSGIGKLTQVIFACLAPGRVLPNLIAGALSEAAAQQSGDMMQDFKTAHLLGVCPKCQVLAMLVGSFVSCWLSAGFYALFSRVYEVGGPQLPAPTSVIWIDMARLVTGGSLPTEVVRFCWAGVCVGVVLGVLPDILEAMRRVPAFRTPGSFSGRLVQLMEWSMPSGTGFAIGMYILPQFVLPRLIGSIIGMGTMWIALAPRSQRGNMLVVASGLVLGEGVMSLFLMILKSVM